MVSDKLKSGLQDDAGIMSLTLFVTVMFAKDLITRDFVLLVLVCIGMIWCYGVYDYYWRKKHE